MMLLLLGPLGVLPRSLMVASGGVSLVFENIPMPWIALVMVFLGYFLALSKDVIRWIGQYFTPMILIGLLVIVMGAFFLPLQINHAHTGAFWDALSTGYQTMDLIAALFFARALSSALTQKDVQSMHAQMLYAVGFGFACLLLVYAAMVLVSYQLSDQLIHVASEKRIVYISSLVMGDYAKAASSFVIASACMTTFAVLLKEFVQFFSQYLPQWSISQLTFVVSLVSYMGSFMGFDSLATVIGFVLQLIYPALILFVVVRPLQCFKPWMHVMAFYGCISLNLVLNYVLL